MIFGLLLIMSAIKIVNPMVFSSFIDDCLMNKNQQSMMRFIFIMIILFLATHVLEIVIKVLTTMLKNKLDYDLSINLLSSLFNKDISFYDKKNTGEILQILLNEIDSIKGLFCDTILQFFVLVVEFVFMLVIVTFYNFKISLLTAILVPLVFFFQTMYKNRVTKIQKKAREAISVLSGDLNDSITGITTIKTNLLQKYRIESYKGKLKKVIESYNEILLNDSVYKCIMAALFFLPVLAICFFVGQEVIEGWLTVGQFTLLYTYSVKMLSPISSISNLSIGFNKATVFLQRYMKLIEDGYDKGEQVQCTKAYCSINKITIDGLGFSYSQDEKVFENITVEFSKGNIYYIAGNNGAGKSTLFNILVGLINPALIDGRILINNEIEWNGDTINSILGNISIAPQHPFLFNDLSVIDNIIFDSQCIEKNELLELINGFSISELLKSDFIVQRNGENLSGGQKQKLSILRALYRNTEVLILDEPFKEMDVESKKMLCAYLDNIKKEKIILISSHEELSYLKDYVTVSIGG